MGAFSGSAVTCVYDSTHLNATQVAFADRILLNKTDLVTEAELAPIEVRLQKMIPATYHLVPTAYYLAILSRSGSRRSLPPPNPNPNPCLLYTSPSPRDRNVSRMPSSA